MSIALRGATVECKTATGSNFGMQNRYKNLTLQLDGKAHLEAKAPQEFDETNTLTATTSVTPSSVRSFSFLYVVILEFRTSEISQRDFL